jgi:phosphoenolpyruvate carboxylase
MAEGVGVGRTQYPLGIPSVNRPRQLDALVTIERYEDLGSVKAQTTRALSIKELFLEYSKKYDPFNNPDTSFANFLRLNKEILPDHFGRNNFELLPKNSREVLLAAIVPAGTKLDITPTSFGIEALKARIKKTSSKPHGEVINALNNNAQKALDESATLIKRNEQVSMLAAAVVEGFERGKEPCIAYLDAVMSLTSRGVLVLPDEDTPTRTEVLGRGVENLLAKNDPESQKKALALAHYADKITHKGDKELTKKATQIIALQQIYNFIIENSDYPNPIFHTRKSEELINEIGRLIQTNLKSKKQGEISGEFLLAIGQALKESSNQGSNNSSMISGFIASQFLEKAGIALVKQRKSNDALVAYQAGMESISSFATSLRNLSYKDPSINFKGYSAELLPKFDSLGSRLKSLNPKKDSLANLQESRSKLLAALGNNDAALSASADSLVGILDPQGKYKNYLNSASLSGNRSDSDGLDRYSSLLQEQFINPISSEPKGTEGKRLQHFSSLAVNYYDRAIAETLKRGVTVPELTEKFLEYIERAQSAGNPGAAARGVQLISSLLTHVPETERAKLQKYQQAATLLSRSILGSMCGELSDSVALSEQARKLLLTDPEECKKEPNKSLFKSVLSHELSAKLLLAQENPEKGKDIANVLKEIASKNILSRSELAPLEYQLVKGLLQANIGKGENDKALLSLLDRYSDFEGLNAGLKKQIAEGQDVTLPGLSKLLSILQISDRSSQEDFERMQMIGTGVGIAVGLVAAYFTRSGNTVKTTIATALAVTSAMAIGLRFKALIQHRDDLTSALKANPTPIDSKLDAAVLLLSATGDGLSFTGLGKGVSSLIRSPALRRDGLGFIGKNATGHVSDITHYKAYRDLIERVTGCGGIAAGVSGLAPLALGIGNGIYSIATSDESSFNKSRLEDKIAQTIGRGIMLAVATELGMRMPKTRLMRNLSDLNLSSIARETRIPTAILRETLLSQIEAPSVAFKKPLREHPEHGKIVQSSLKELFQGLGIDPLADARPITMGLFLAPIDGLAGGEKRVATAQDKWLTFIATLTNSDQHLTSFADHIIESARNGSKPTEVVINELETRILSDFGITDKKAFSDEKPPQIVITLASLKRRLSERVAQLDSGSSPVFESDKIAVTEQQFRSALFGEVEGFEKFREAQTRLINDPTSLEAAKGYEAQAKAANDQSSDVDTRLAQRAICIEVSELATRFRTGSHETDFGPGRNRQKLFDRLREVFREEFNRELDDIPPEKRAELIKDWFAKPEGFGKKFWEKIESKLAPVVYAITTHPTTVIQEKLWTDIVDVAKELSKLQPDTNGKVSLPEDLKGKITTLLSRSDEIAREKKPTLDEEDAQGRGYAMNFVNAYPKYIRTMHQLLLENFPQRTYEGNQARENLTLEKTAKLFQRGLATWVKRDADNHQFVTPDETLNAARQDAVAVLQSHKANADSISALCDGLPDTKDQINAIAKEIQVGITHYQNLIEGKASTVEIITPEKLVQKIKDFEKTAADLGLTNIGLTNIVAKAEDLRMQVESFGYRLQMSEPRQSSDLHFGAVKEIAELVESPIKSHFSDSILSADDLQTNLATDKSYVSKLEKAILDPDDKPLTDDQWKKLEEAKNNKIAELRSQNAPEEEIARARADSAYDALDRFRKLAQVQKEIGKDAVDLYIISMSKGIGSIAEVLYLMKKAGVLTTVKEDGRIKIDVPFQVVPLFETGDDLQKSTRKAKGYDAESVAKQNETFIKAFRDSAIGQAYLLATNGRFVFMLGESDTRAFHGRDRGTVLLSTKSHGAVMASRGDAYSGIIGMKIELYFGTGGKQRGDLPEDISIATRPDVVSARPLIFTKQGQIAQAHFSDPDLAVEFLTRSGFGPMLKLLPEFQDEALTKNPAWGAKVITPISLLAAEFHEKFVQDPTVDTNLSENKGSLKMYEQNSYVNANPNAGSRPASRAGSKTNPPQFAPGRAIEKNRLGKGLGLPALTSLSTGHAFHEWFYDGATLKVDEAGRFSIEPNPEKIKLFKETYENVAAFREEINHSLVWAARTTPLVMLRQAENMEHFVLGKPIHQIGLEWITEIRSTFEEAMKGHNSKHLSELKDRLRREESRMKELEPDLLAAQARMKNLYDKLNQLPADKKDERKKIESQMRRLQNVTYALLRDAG